MSNNNPYKPGFWPFWGFWSFELVNYLRNKRLGDKKDRELYRKIADYIENSDIKTLTVETANVSPPTKEESLFDYLMFETFGRFKTRIKNRPASLGIDVIEDIKDWTRETFPEFRDQLPKLVFK